MTLPRVADSLAGRMATIDLLPLSPAELPQRRLSLGLPLLRPAPLQGSPLRDPTGTSTTAPQETEASVAGESGVAIEPEQATEESGGSELDQPVG